MRAIVSSFPIAKSISGMGTTLRSLSVLDDIGHIHSYVALYEPGSALGSKQNAPDETADVSVRCLLLNFGVSGALDAISGPALGQAAPISLFNTYDPSESVLPYDTHMEATVSSGSAVPTVTWLIP